MATFQTYDPKQTWLWNLQHAPVVQQVEAQAVVGHGEWSWCGHRVTSPLGIPAGPLLDSRWLLHYARLGFDILVYKTVRSVARECYPLPNLVPVSTGPLAEAGGIVPETQAMDGTWAVSFGMPSQHPDVWRQDVSAARASLPPGKVLVVSVVGSQDESITDADASLKQLANDFAQCAEWAVDSGAHGIEANFSCPNVCTSDGQLYQQPQAAGRVAEQIRSRIGDTPLVLKIGRVTSAKDATDLLEQVGPHINGLAMTNSIAAKVARTDGSLLFDGQPRGICGNATRTTSVSQTAMFRQVLNQLGLSLDLIGVGGISKTEHVRDYLSAGATSVAIATAAMVDPELGLKIRRDLSNPSNSGA